MHEAGHVLESRLARLRALACSTGVDPAALQLPTPFEAWRAATSYMQRRLWFVEHFQAEVSAYQVPAALRLSGPLDVRVLERAIQRFVNRHDALRTTLVDELGLPVMAIAPSLDFHLEVRRLPPCDEADAVAQFLASSAPVVRARFALAARPPWRAVLFERTPTDFFLLFVFHHTIFDGWSIDLLFREISAAYDEMQGGAAASPDDPGRLQYPEFAAWQHARAAAGAFDADVEFWVRNLQGAPERLDIRGDRGRSLNAEAIEGHHVRQALDPAMAKRLVDAGLAQHATPFAAGLALWCAWLRKETGTPDLIVGTPSGGRSVTAFESIVGPCINTLALRLNMAGASTYSALIRMAREATLVAREHENAPIDRVLGQLRPGRTAGRTPIAQTAFTSPVIRRVGQFGGLAVERVFPPIPGAKSDVALEISRRLDRWTVSLEYSTAIFSPDGAREALHDFLTFSESLLASPDRPLQPSGAPRRLAAAGGLPLTSSQLRMWLDQARSPLAPIYNVPATIELEGPFDRVAFDRAFERLVASHDALRLTFSTERGAPVQRVSEARGEVVHVDFSSATAEERAAWLAHEIAAPFDLAGVLFRCTIARVHEGRHLWVFVQHHLIADGSSTQLLVERLSDLYQRERRGDRSPVSFPSFAAHLARTSGRTPSYADCTVAPGSGWWEQQFEGVERPRFFGARVEKAGTSVTRSQVPLDESHVQMFFAATSRDRTTSPEQAALLVATSALVALLYRMTGERRIGLGMPFHNRRGREERAIAGPFMDVLPIAVDCAPDDTLADVSQRVALSLRQTLRHAKTPPPASVRARGCDVLVNVQTVAISEFCGARTRPVWVHPGHERESLSLQVQMDGCGGVTFHLDTHDEVFDAWARNRMIARFGRVLAQCIDSPHMRIADVPLVNEDEMRATVEAGRGATRPDAYAATALEAIESRAARQPRAVAVEESGHRSITYGELIDQAQRVAAGLTERGIQGGDVVGVSLPRSIDYVVAVLGILGAGAAYMPLDPAAPALRRERCITRAGARTVVIRVADVIAASARPFARRAAGDLAYVIFTSGSTGEPKGVEITDRSLSNYTNFAAARFGLTPHDRALQFAALTFDTAVEEVFPTLVSGATLVLRDDEMLVSPEAFADAVAARRISVINLPTSYWHVLATAGTRMPDSVRLVIVGGEEMRRDLVARWCAANRPDVALLNGYGPTEATVVATMADVPRAEHHGPVSIGQPVWNAEVHVVDASGRIAPAGHAGELVVGGAGLARGYRNDPASTAARFIAHPLTPGSRLYRTGDRGRIRADGAIEFLGRLDDQIKIRGFRVEPGEVASRLRQHPAIDDAVVVAVAGEGGAELQAFLVVKGAAPLTGREIRTHLRERLPEYMMPRTFFVIPEIPRTPSGKPDPRRLDACSIALEEAPDTQAPETAIQARIAAVWNVVLRRDSTGIHDNFFDVGGHSLLATQVVARLSADLDVRVPLRAIFDRPTIAGLADVIEHELSFVPNVAPPKAVREQGPFPLSFAQERLWFAEQLTPGTQRFTMPSVLRLNGVLDTGALQRALDALFRRHPALRTRLLTGNDTPQQHVHAAARVPIEQIDVSTSADRQKAAEAAAADVLGRTFDVASGPLVRVALLHGGEREHWLVFAFHHLIFDGWSVHIVVEELTALYAAERRREPAALPVEGADYASFIRWQRDRLRGDAVAPLIQYWREQLVGLPELRLVPDGDVEGDSSAGVESLLIDDETIDRLTRQAAEMRATPFMIAAAALSVVLSRWSGQDDVVFGVPVAGRTRPEFERTVGLFLNTVPLRIKVSDEQSAASLIERARDAAIGAFAHQELPFERLVEELAPERSASRHPFFDVLLNFVNTPKASIALDGLDITPVDGAPADAKYPLTIYALPRGDGLALRAVYMRAMFDGASVAAFLEEFVSVLRQLIDSPTRAVGEVTLVTARARQLLADPSTSLPVRSFETVAEQFARACDADPGALAIDDRGTPVTYAELNGAAGAVQRHLDTSGVPMGAAVAITGPVTSRSIAALIGVIGSGRVAVPIDSAASEERRRSMAAEAKISAWLDTDSEFPIPPAGARLKPVRGGDAAYIVFTSGTTGTPKAVLGSHLGLSQFIEWERETIGVTPDDRVARVTAPTFDVFLREALVPLTAGASLHIGSADEDALSDATLDWFDRAGITIVHAVPTLAQFWISADPARRVPSLRCTLFAGEPLTSTLATRWRGAAPASRIINLYGPTETTLAKCWYEVPAAMRAPVAPIGRAIDGAQALVMRGAAPCGIGEAGEIVIRTPYRSLGYLNAPDTARRFVQNPFSADPRDILYRTGDRGHYLADGTIRIAGRFDDALKIRGVRVDTAEVAAVIATHTHVQAAAVVADLSHDDPLLVACVVTCGDVTADVVRRHVERRLAPAARPSRVVFAAEIPRTTNGKVDRRAVIEMVRADAGLTQEDEAPATETECALARVWCELLGCDRVARHTDFFDVGGHSLLTARLAARIRSVFEVEIPVRAIFDMPTLAGLASAIDLERTTARARVRQIPRADRERYRTAAAPARGGAR
jgi:amino acid adenylation domain-containing protein